MYEIGLGVPENDVEAVKWYRLAAEQGYASAQYKLGNMYDEGSVLQNNVRAYVWWSVAAAQGQVVLNLIIRIVSEQTTNNNNPFLLLLMLRSTISL